MTQPKTTIEQIYKSVAKQIYPTSKEQEEWVADKLTSYEITKQGGRITLRQSQNNKTQRYKPNHQLTCYPIIVYTQYNIPPQYKGKTSDYKIQSIQSVEDMKNTLTLKLQDRELETVKVIQNGELLDPLIWGTLIAVEKTMV